MTAAERVRQRVPRRRKSSSLPAKNKPPAPKLSGRPNVLILGKSALSARLTRAIRREGLRCRRIDTPGETEGAIDEHTRALLIVPPIPSFSVLQFARQRRAPPSGVPLFVVMEGPLPAPTVGKLYRAGVDAIFEWPADGRAVKRTLFRLTAPRVGRWGRKKTVSEIALEETARNHIDAVAGPFGAKLGVEATGRFLLLKGSLDALWKLELTRQLLLEIPGVEDVVAGGVEIRGQARDDTTIANAIRTVLRHAAGVDKSTLAVSVRSGEVTLTGSVHDKHEANRTLELIRQVRGVRSVQDYLVVTPRGKQRDRALARRVRDVLSTKYPELCIGVAVFGDIAVLSGRVPRAALRERVEELVRRQRGVARVVDKLAVSGRARR